MSDDALKGHEPLNGPSSAEEGPKIDSRAFQKLIELGIALSSETDGDRLLENILLGMKELTHADGGTIYLRIEDNRLSFATMRNDTLGVAMGGTTGKPIPFPLCPYGGQIPDCEEAPRGLLTGLQVYSG